MALTIVEDLDELEEVGAGLSVGFEPDASWSRMWAISLFRVAQNVSMAALSKQSPVEPNDSWSPAWPAAMTKSSEVY